MKLIFLFFFISCSLSAQFRLEVQGNMSISGGIYFLNNRENAFVGNFAGQSNTTGSYNSFFGPVAGYNNTTGEENCFFGLAAGYYNITGSRNSFIGRSSGAFNTTGSDNSFVGRGSGYSNTIGNYNSIFGNDAGYSNTTGSWNSFFGFQAGRNNTTGQGNSFFGRSAGISNTTGIQNSFFGHAAGFSNTGSSNSFFGGGSGSSNTTGHNNSFFGTSAGLFSTTGYNNSFFGTFAGYDNQTGNNRTGLGYHANSLGTNLDNSTGLGYDADPTSNNETRIGNESVTSISGNVGFSSTSDARFKTQVNRENIPGIAFIKKLSPVTYYFDLKKFGDWKYEQFGERDSTSWSGKYDIETILQTGFIAQEVEAAAQSIGYDFSGVDKPASEKSYYGLRYSTFVVPLVKAVQEQQEQIEEQEKELIEYKGLIREQQNLLVDQVQKNKQLETRIIELEHLVRQILEVNRNDLNRKEEKVILSPKPQVEQNIPNPFEGTTRIDFFLPETNIKNSFLLITGADGKEIRRIKLQNSGKGSILIEMDKLSQGTYYYSLIVDGQIIETKSMLFVK